MRLRDTRQPDRPMITEEEALKRIMASVRPLPPRIVPLIEAREQFAASDVLARVALPAFDNSAMDGYAVVVGACADGKGQRVIGEQPAGVDRGLRLAEGEAKPAIQDRKSTRLNSSHVSEYG